MGEEQVHPARVESDREDRVRGPLRGGERDHERVVVVVDLLDGTGRDCAQARERSPRYGRNLGSEPLDELLELRLRRHGACDDTRSRRVASRWRQVAARMAPVARHGAAAAGRTHRDHPDRLELVREDGGSPSTCDDSRCLLLVSFFIPGPPRPLTQGGSRCGEIRSPGSCPGAARKGPTMNGRSRPSNSTANSPMRAWPTPRLDERRQPTASDAASYPLRSPVAFDSSAFRTATARSRATGTLTPRVSSPRSGPTNSRVSSPSRSSS